MYLFSGYIEQMKPALSLLKKSKFLPTHSQAEFFHFIVSHVLEESQHVRIDLPMANREYFAVAVSMEMGKGKHPLNLKIASLVEEIELWTRLYIAKIENSTIQEQKVLFLIRKFLLLYNGKILFPDLVYALVAEVNMMDTLTWSIEPPEEVLGGELKNLHVVETEEANVELN